MAFSRTMLCVRSSKKEKTSACYFFVDDMHHTLRLHASMQIFVAKIKYARGSSSRCALAAKLFRAAHRSLPRPPYDVRVHDFFLGSCRGKGRRCGVASAATLLQYQRL